MFVVASFLMLVGGALWRHLRTLQAPIQPIRVMTRPRIWPPRDTFEPPRTSRSDSDSDSSSPNTDFVRGAYVKNEPHYDSPWRRARSARSA